MLVSSGPFYAQKIINFDTEVKRNYSVHLTNQKDVPLTPKSPVS